MWKKILILLVIFLAVEGLIIISAPYIRSVFKFSYVSEIQEFPKINIATSSLEIFLEQKREPEVIQAPSSEMSSTPEIQPSAKTQPPKTIQPLAPVIKEVSSKSLTELINSSVIQLYCGNMNAEETQFSEIARGTGIIINSNGIILTNRHIVYDEIFKKLKSDCFVLKSPFPNPAGQKPKIYYFVKIENWPQTEKFSKDFSENKYYNDIALLKISGKTTTENSKIGAILGFDYASAGDYEILENGGRFNYLPIDWSYIPRAGDNVISAGYGTDASHEARQITSTAGTVEGNIEVLGGNRIEMLIIKGNATAGFSGGALIHPQTKGFLGLVSWVSAGAEEGKFTVAIFRDFLRDLMRQEFNIDLKELTGE